MAVAFNNNFKAHSKFKSRTKDFVYNFDSGISGREYIAVPAKTIGQPVTFQKSMKVTLLMGQIFGLNPVLGICSEDPSMIRFTVYSGRCVYTILTIVGQTLALLLYFLKTIWEYEASLESNSGVVFFGTNIAITILFLKVAREWPKLCRQISDIEAVDPTTDKHLIKKCNITCIVLLVAGLVEHGLSDVTGVSVTIACQPDKPIYETHIQTSLYWIWVYIPYNKLFAAIAKFICVQLTFNWNYSGVFVMCVCMYLSARFQQINERIGSVKGQIVPHSFWRTIRQDYYKTCYLVRDLDEIINGIIFVTYFSSVFSICFQILHTLKEGVKAPVICNVPVADRLFKGYEHVIYYLYSIIVLLVRSIAMSLVAADVNSTSARTATFLYEVSTDSFNIEVQRLIDLVHGDPIAMSGLNLFNVKRGIVLTISAAIITYELVLIQFAGSE